MQEEWKDVKEFEGLYKISNFGRVKSLKAWNGNKYTKKYIDIDKIIKPMKEKSGYLKVVLHNSNKKQNKRIHRLVAETFIDNPYNYKCINHIDGNKENNKIDNLEWCTQKYNVIDAVNKNLRKFTYHGKYKKYISYDKRNKNFYVRIKMDSKNIYLGAFKNINEAINKRNQFLKDNNIRLYNNILKLEQDEQMLRGLEIT